MSELNVELYSTFDKPYPFSRKGDEEPLLIYPAVVRDFYMFNYLSKVLTVDKEENISKNPFQIKKILEMSYLEYLIREHIKAEENDDTENLHLLYLRELFMIVLRKKDIDFSKYGFDEKNKPFIILDGIKYNHHDFEKIRKIICHQNLIELPNELIQKELRDKMKEAEEIKRRMSGKKETTLEDYIISLSVSTGLPMETIYDMTIRKFRKSLERIDHKMHYEIYLQASMSGFVKFKKKDAIKHWMANLEKDPLFGLVPYDEVENTINSANN